MLNASPSLQLLQIVKFRPASRNTPAKSAAHLPSTAPMWRRQTGDSMMIPGKLTLTPFCIAAALVFGGASMAEAGWSRSGGGTGTYGRSWSSSGRGSCAYGACSSCQAFTGPRGQTVTRNGSSSCSGGSCNSSATWTGPGGQSVTRSGSISRY